MNNYYLMDTGPEYNYLLDAVEVFMKELLPRHKTLDISVEVKKVLDFNAEGFTENLDDLSKPREFLISLSMDSEDIIKTLAHECIHVMQYVKYQDYSEPEAYAKELELSKKYKHDTTN